MTPLEAARYLVENRPAAGGTRTHRDRRGFCYYCHNDTGNRPHRPECPWLQMPQIVAALEAIESAQDQLMFLSHPHVREDHLAVLSIADRVRSRLPDRREGVPLGIVDGHLAPIQAADGEATP